MKKFYAIVLGLLMVLGLASVASAEFALSGQFVVKGVINSNNDPAWGGLDYSSDTRFELKFTGTYGNVSGDLKFRLKEQDGSALPVGDFVQFRTGNMFYKFSDALSVGITEDITGDLNVYQTMVDSGWAWTYDDGDAYLRANIALGDFNASVLTNLFEDDALWLYAGATYKLDPVTIGFAIDYYDEDYEILPGVNYALTEELSFDGEVYYNSDEDLLIGLGVNYATDALSVEAGFWYDMTDGAPQDIAYYFVYASYSVTDNLDLYFNYFDKEYSWNFPGEDHFGYEVGATLYLDEDDKSSIDFNYAEEDEDLTLTFKVKF